MKKIILASLLMMSCITTAEMKLYTISFGLAVFDQQNIVINFLHDDEAFPDYTNNVNLNMWTTDSDIITTVDGKPAILSDSFYSIGEGSWGEFEIKFDTGNGLNNRLIIYAVTSHGPENTFNLSSGSASGSLRMDGSMGGNYINLDNLSVSNLMIQITAFTGTDEDGDLVDSTIDNCPLTSNASQLDGDNDGLGNSCDSTPNGDDDDDGVDNAVDNCINIENSNQANLDGDSQGDACDLDVDGDLILDSVEVAAGTDPNDPNDGPEEITETLGINKNVPAMGGIGLLALGLSMLGLGAVRLRKK
ncbi:MAG: thrombospondin type 3 repeat-containing protein [Pseudomonadales bacterium]|nr:thrombospondin type 3 repeat-containing protein [Pseudomonadales bacterium]